MLSCGVVSTAMKEDELRAPIHPDHFRKLSSEVRENLWLERGYGNRFGVSDDDLAPWVAGFGSRAEMFDRDVVLLPKPTEGDFPFFRDGLILWGWPHCVQGPAITQAAIDNRMTVLAWEAMQLWNGEQWLLHVFHKNNELAGYCSVLHALRLAGITGHYGEPRRACVIGFGSTGRGAIHALQGLGFGDVTQFTERPGGAVSAPIPSVKHWQMVPTDQGTEVLLDTERMTMAKALGHFDVVVNCILQDTDAPQMFVDADEIHELRRGTVVIDVSCDEGMGFAWARPTSFREPMFEVEGRIQHYGVDHSPSFLWRSATWEISESLVPHVAAVLDGPDGWKASNTLSRCVEIRDGVVVNPKILSFQHREATFPHPILSP
jgi:alanine dehydrogenase